MFLEKQHEVTIFGTLKKKTTENRIKRKIYKFISRRNRNHRSCPMRTDLNKLSYKIK